jgi:hypothetical protein
MTAPHADNLIAGYVGQLQEALSELPPARREEIVAEIQQHIAEARAALPAETDTDVLDILDRVGHPADIADEARLRLGAPESVRRTSETGEDAEVRGRLFRRGPGPLEIAALLLVGFSGLVYPIPPVGWVLGVALVWLLPCWSPRDKRLGAYLPLVAALAVGVVAALIGP